MFKALAGVAVAAGLLIAGATAAEAHTPSVVATCEMFSVRLDNYEGVAANNHVTITIDGGTFTHEAGAGGNATYNNNIGEPQHTGNLFRFNQPWSATVDHTWAVDIDANILTGDPTRYDSHHAGTQKACQPLPTTTSIAPPTTTIPPTTTEAATTTTVPAVVVTFPPTTPAPPSTEAPVTEPVFVSTTAPVVASVVIVGVGQPPVPTAPTLTALPVTGASDTVWLYAGAACLAIGVTMLWVRRPRRAR